ncbi:hypothetical protein GQ856_03385 [Vibrio parahaemolyticus]|nr:hypothetical protein [Vibrio parahaemolyticus]
MSNISVVKITIGFSIRARPKRGRFYFILGEIWDREN